MLLFNFTTLYTRLIPVKFKKIGFIKHNNIQSIFTWKKVLTTSRLLQNKTFYSITTNL